MAEQQERQRGAIMSADGTNGNTHHRAVFADDVLDDAMAAILRSKTPAERLAIAFRLWTFAKNTLRETLRRDHPEWGEAELRRRVARRMSHGAV
jgi:hypothetical protein